MSGPRVGLVPLPACGQPRSALVTRSSSSRSPRSAASSSCPGLPASRDGPLSRRDLVLPGRYAGVSGGPPQCTGAVRYIALPGAGFVPYAGAVPDGGRHGFNAARTVAKPPSSSGLGHRPFKAAARVRIPLGARLAGSADGTHGPVEQLGVLATLSRWRSRVQIPSGPLSRGAPRPGQVAQSV